MKALKLKFTILGLSSMIFINAQIDKPSLSPKISSEQKVGLATVKLEYGQPNKQNRKIFGALIPYGKLWRTGANSATKISFNQDVTLANNPIPAGTYGLYSIPGEKEWTIIIHKNSTLWGAGGYQQKNDLVRFTVPVTSLKNTFETLSLHFENFNTNGGDFIIAWENTKINIPLFVDSDKIIFKEITSKIKNATEPIKAQTYFDAAQFYYLKKIKLDTAMSWFDRAIESKPNAYWYVYYKAELAYFMKKYAMAKENAIKSLTAAKESPSTDYGYISKNELLLKQIVGKTK